LADVSISFNNYVSGTMLQTQVQKLSRVADHERWAKSIDTAMPNIPGDNPTIACYNATVVNFYNGTGSLALFEKKLYFEKRSR
jgi:hypothetical protein